jgi:threonine dehydrogenase-like Zn-dependent dehydrogenase
VEEWQGKRVRTFALALELLQQGAASLKGLVTHRFPLTQWRAAIQTALQAGRNRAIKVVLENASVGNS